MVISTPHVGCLSHRLASGAWGRSGNPRRRAPQRSQILQSRARLPDMPLSTMGYDLRSSPRLAPSESVRVQQAAYWSRGNLPGSGTRPLSVWRLPRTARGVSSRAGALRARVYSGLSWPTPRIVDPGRGKATAPTGRARPAGAERPEDRTAPGTSPSAPVAERPVLFPLQSPGGWEARSTSREERSWKWHDGDSSRST